ncbi:MAG: transcription antitermination factor NusB [Pseudomonadota bacterium]
MTGTQTANKRRAARLSAVQALYQMDMSGTGIADIVSEYEQLRIGKEVDGEEYLEADLSWFRGLVSGVVKHQESLDPVINEKLMDDWPLSRIDILLRALLRCGAFELFHRKDVPEKVVINEYLEIAKAFFEGEEPKLVNAVLDSIAKGI